jgi:hypothetical protein
VEVGPGLKGKVITRFGYWKSIGAFSTGLSIIHVKVEERSVKNKQQNVDGNVERHSRI